MENRTIYCGISVDDSTARLLDDAFWAEETKQGTVLRIFTPNLYSRLEKRLWHDNYFSNKSSLMSEKNHYCLCYEFLFKKETCTLIGFTVFSCYFRNIHSMNYEMLDAVLDQPIHTQPLVSKEVLTAIVLTYRLMYNFYCQKRSRAHIIFQNYKKAPREIDANGMVGLVMVFLNSTVANFAVKNLIPFVFTKQQPWRTVREELDLKNKDLLLRAMEMKPLPKEDTLAVEFQLNHQKYCPTPTDHWGHLIPWYCHISSPSRRLADFINQTNLICFLKKKKYFYSMFDIEQLSLLCNQGVDENFFQENLVKKEVARMISLNRSYALLDLVKSSRGKHLALGTMKGRSYEKLLRICAEDCDLKKPIYIVDFDTEKREFTCEACIGINGKIISETVWHIDRKICKENAAKALYKRAKTSTLSPLI